jgi:hypothetical protein
MPHNSWLALHIGIGGIIFYAVPFLLLGEHLTAGAQWRTSGRVWGMTRTSLSRVYRVVLVTTLVLAIILVGRVISRKIVDPTGWDFQALWLYGRVADSGQNPYLPGPYPAMAGPGPFNQDFREEVLEVGAVYPPPTLLLFGAVGWLPLRVAIVPWMVVQTIAFIGMVVLLWRIFMPDHGGWGLALMFTLALLLAATIATFGHGQVNFMAVLCVLAAWRTRDRAISGVWIVASTILKLMYGILWLYPLLRGRWRPFTGIIVATVAALIASVIAFGFPMLRTYVIDNPVQHRMPSYYFTTYVNQSLLGASIRLMPYPRSVLGPPIHHPLYIISALLVTMITIWLAARLPRTVEGEDAAFILLILAGMLIYPWTISNYFVLLLVPMGYLWARRNRSPLGALWTLLLISAVYPLTYYANGLYSIVATVMLWVAVLITAIHTMRTVHSGADNASESPSLAASLT